MTQSRRRTVLWLVFAVLFLGTPVVTFLFGKANSWLLILVVGAFASGNVLASVKQDPEDSVIFRGMMFGIGIMFVYLGVAFVGCLVALNGIR